MDDDVLAWHQGVEPETDFLRKLIDVRLMVEPNAAFWAAGAATNEQIKEISKSHNDMENAKSIQEFVVADAKFHRAVLRGANNELLTAMEGVIFSALLSSIKITNNDPIDNRERSLPLHYKILKAIETQNKERAEFAMRKHMADTYERLSKLLPELKSGVKKCSFTSSTNAQIGGRASGCSAKIIKYFVFYSLLILGKPPTRGIFCAK